MKYLVTGYAGQLGFDIVREFERRGIDAVGVDVKNMDITDAQKVHEVISAGGYDGVIHCAAYTAVDAAEDNIDLCRKINVEGTAHIAHECENLGIPMMYFSTDYVFNGEGEEPWNEYDPREPLNVYGQTKYEGELIVEKLAKYFIIRISWVFGKNGKNFIQTMLRLGRERGEVSVVDDQVGSPTYTFDLAKLCVEMIQTDAYGIYHAPNEGLCSWYDFACEIFSQANMDVKVNPVDSSSFVTKAKRPKNSRMNRSELDRHGFQRLPLWQDALHRYLNEMNEI